MSDQPEVFTLHVNDKVSTPNGPGIIQGRMVKDGQTLIIIAHSPHDPDVSSEVKRDVIRDVWIRRFYTLDQIKPFTTRPVATSRSMLAIGRTIQH